MGEIAYASTDSVSDESRPHDLRLSPFAAVTKFCYTFVKKDYQQAVASAFFDQGKIWARSWDIYAAHTHSSPPRKSVFFVPAHQLWALVAEINQRFLTARVSITKEDIERGLVIDFSHIPDSLRPQHVGTCRSRDEFKSLSNIEPQLDSTMACQGTLLSTYQNLLSKADGICKGRGKKLTQDDKAMARDRQLALACQILAITPQSVTNQSAIDSTDVIDRASVSGFADDTILVAIDIEAKERNKSAITEVGIAVLDTRELTHIAPAQSGRNWHDKIRAKHIRVLEHISHVNHEFVRGCPDAFEFGTSDYVPQADLVSAISGVFRSLSAESGLMQAPPSSDSVDLELYDSRSGSELRNVVLVGHNISQDIEYFKSVGFDIIARKNVIQTLDTQHIYQAVTREINPCSLGGILNMYGLVGWNLHNAGNDAVYTLWALFALVTAEDKTS